MDKYRRLRGRKKTHLFTLRIFQLPVKQFIFPVFLSMVIAKKVFLHVYKEVKNEKVHLT